MSACRHLVVRAASVSGLPGASHEKIKTVERGNHGH